MSSVRISTAAPLRDARRHRAGAGAPRQRRRDDPRRVPARRRDRATVAAAAERTARWAARAARRAQPRGSGALRHRAGRHRPRAARRSARAIVDIGFEATRSADSPSGAAGGHGGGGGDRAAAAGDRPRYFMGAGRPRTWLARSGRASTFSTACCRPATPATGRFSPARDRWSFATRATPTTPVRSTSVPLLHVHEFQPRLSASPRDGARAPGGDAQYPAQRHLLSDVMRAIRDAIAPTTASRRSLASARVIRRGGRMPAGVAWAQGGGAARTEPRQSDAVRPDVRDSVLPADPAATKAGARARNHDPEPEAQ